MNELGPSLQLLLQEHIQRMSFPIDKYASGEISFIAPYILPSQLIQVLDYATAIVASDPIVINVDMPTYIIGDLHGHLFDLYRIFQNLGLPPESNYIFLGDFVDRGVYSTEVIMLVVILKILYPKNIFIIRGNHEFVPTKPNNTFRDEISQLYVNHQDILNRFYKFFSFLPLAAIVGDYVCMHGGIDPKLKTIEQIWALKRPILLASDIVEGIVWSDPKPEQNIAYMNSPRGHGYYFNEKALTEFLDRNKLKGLIRGHLFVDGISSMFDGKCITVFSASNYTPDFTNRCGLLFIDGDGQISQIMYPPLDTPARGKGPKAIPVQKFNQTPQKSVIVPNIMQCRRLSTVRKDSIARVKCCSVPPFERNMSSPYFFH